MTEVWSCGGGTQSGAIAVLIAQGRLPKPDIALMVDTGRERSSTWPFVDQFIRPQLAKVGCPLNIIESAEFKTVDLISAEGSILLPGFTSQSGESGKLPGWCSNEWKQRPVKRWLRQNDVQTARMWMGISRDEMKRVRTPDTLWLSLWYPLIFAVPMSRLDCVELIRSTGWEGIVPHSACWMCPNISDEEWIEMKREWPEDFAAACAMEKDLQKVDPHFWLHGSCKPLAEVDFTAQLSMFADRGCVGGCFT